MQVLNSLTFNYYVFYPKSSELSSNDKKVALAVSILMGIMTLGLGHLICGIAYGINKTRIDSSRLAVITPYEVIEEEGSIISKYTSDQYYASKGIKLKIVDSANEKFGETFGKRVISSHENVIFVNGFSNRIYKIKHINFLNPKEIVISKLAGNLRVAPKIYNVCVFRNKFIMEMDYAGKSLEVLIDEKLINTNFGPLEFKEKLKMHEKYLRKIVKNIYDNAYNVEVIKCLKKLIKNKIAWIDSNPGNIIPTNPLQLIDFEGAELMKNPRAALRKTLPSNARFFESLFSDNAPTKEVQKLQKWTCKTFGVRSNSKMSAKLRQIIKAR